MRILDHHAALRAIGGRLSDMTNKTTEYWTIPESKESEFYDMREAIPFENLLSGFRDSGFIIYLDKPKMDNARLLDAAPDLLQACQNALTALEAQDNINALPIAIWDAMQEMRGAIAMAKS